MNVSEVIAASLMMDAASTSKTSVNNYSKWTFHSAYEVFQEVSKSYDDNF
jgi:hypothetical protein